MTRKMILIVIMLYSFPNSSKCTKLPGIWADKRMNMNVLKMFDRFFHLRHKDPFFIRNFQDRLTDKYLKSYYGEFEMTRSLKADLGMHATYLENTVWHTTSITELFTILYTKYLAANYIISFRNCHWYYTYGEGDEETATKCKKVSNYLHTFMKIAVENYVKRMEEFIHFIRGGEDTGRPFDFLFDAFTSYFTHIISEMLRSEMQPEVPDSKDEFLRRLLLQEKQFELRSRLILKYFFRYVFFDIPMMDLEFLNKTEEEEIAEFKKKKSNSILNETVKFWEIVDKLVKRIEQRDPRVPEPNSKKSHEDNSKTNNLIQSNVAEIIRKLEIRSLKVRGIEPTRISELKSGSKAEVYLFIVEHYSKGGGIYQHFKFVPMQAEHLERARFNVFNNDYLRLAEALTEEDFSPEEQVAISAEKNTSVLLESVAQSAMSESFKTITGSQFLSTSNESFKTINNSMKSISGSRFVSAESYRTNASMRSSSTQLDESKLKANRAKLAAQQGDKSAKNNFSKSSDVSHSKSFLAPDKFSNNSITTGGRNTSNYADVSRSQNVSRSSIRGEYPTYFLDIIKEHELANS